MDTTKTGGAVAVRIYGAESRYGNPIATCEVGKGLETPRWREALALAHRIAAGAVEAGANPNPEVVSMSGTIVYVKVEADEANPERALAWLRAGLASVRGGA